MVTEHKTKREVGVELLREMFANQRRIAIADAVARAAELGVSRRTMMRACKDVGAHEVHNGPYGAFWEIA